MRIKPEDCPNIKRVAEAGFFIRSPHDLLLSNDNSTITRFFPTRNSCKGIDGYEFFNPDQVGDYDSEPRYFKINIGIFFEPSHCACLLIGPSDPRLINVNLLIQPAIIMPGYRRQLSVVVSVRGELPVAIARGDVIAQILPYSVASEVTLVETPEFCVHPRAPEYSITIDGQSSPISITRDQLEYMIEQSPDGIRDTLQSREDFNRIAESYSLYKGN